jgi:site-specific DNA-methyltransferase (adenine-specific)
MLKTAVRLAGGIQQTVSAPVLEGPFAAFPTANPHVLVQGTMLVLADALQWMADAKESSVHAIVTDPPYGLVEYEDEHQEKLRNGKGGGIWRVPPTLDGVKRAPLPRFTVLSAADRDDLITFFSAFAYKALRLLVPGGHLVIASNPLLSTTTFTAIELGGFEKRGELIRVVKTLRGGDRPKGAEKEFPDVSVMPRSTWEPWGLFRKPLSEKTVALNLKKWGTGGFRRISDSEPFKDIFECAPARPAERELGDHPSMKPQKLMRYIVRAVLPLGKGMIYDPFAGCGSTLAAAAALGYHAIGTERDALYFSTASKAIAKLAAFNPA